MTRTHTVYRVNWWATIVIAVAALATGLGVGLFVTTGGKPIGVTVETKELAAPLTALGKLVTERLDEAEREAADAKTLAGHAGAVAHRIENDLKSQIDSVEDFAAENVPRIDVRINALEDRIQALEARPVCNCGPQPTPAKPPSVLVTPPAPKVFQLPTCPNTRVNK